MDQVGKKRSVDSGRVDRRGHRIMVTGTSGMESESIKRKVQGLSDLGRPLDQIDIGEAIAIASHSTSENDLTVLSFHSSSRVKNTVASRDMIPDDAINELICDRSEKVRESLATNTDINPVYIALMATDESTRVSSGALSNPALDDAALEELAESDNVVVLQAVARHGNTSEEVLLKLAEHQDAAVRDAVSQNPQLTDAVQEKLTGTTSTQSVPSK